MPNQSLSSCKAKTAIQNIIQDVSFSIKPLIYKALGVYKASKSTIRYYFTSYLLQYKAYLSLLYPL